MVDLDDQTVRMLPSFGDVRNVGWGRAGEILVVQNVNGSVDLWDVENDSFAGKLWTGNGSGFGSPWSDEATNSIWVAASDEIVKLPMDKNVWSKRACEAAGRNLTQDEWDRLVPGGGQVQYACG